jgi:very-short-patch-repair endonuclease
MRNKLDPPDDAVANLAARQHGVVTRKQLLAAGLSPSAISRRVEKGWLHRLYQGVYAVGHRGISREGRWLAAVLACGDFAVLSHWGAAALWDLLPHPRGPVDVSTSMRGGRVRRPGIRLHRCRSLTVDLTTERRGIPVTTPARTIADLLEAGPAWQSRRAIRQAEMRGMRLGPGVEVDRTSSDLERDFLRLCRHHGLPTPEVNVKVGPYAVDFLWRRERIAVETDSYAYHRGRVAFQDDRARDMELRRRGFVVHRFSERQLNEQPAEVVADLRRALEMPGCDLA